MNAEELADKLEERSSNYTYHGHYNKEAAIMLRKQQAEIEALKLRELTEDEIKEVYDQYFDLENFGWLHLQCIREILEKAREK